MSKYAPIRLRPHHLLCILTYVGKGYSESFIHNMDQIVKTLSTGQASINIDYGPDDICAPRVCDDTDASCHCYESQITDRDNNVLDDLKKHPEFSIIKLREDLILTEDLISKLRTAYKKEEIRTACRGCEWYDLCTTTSKADFHGVKLNPSSIV